MKPFCLRPKMLLNRISRLGLICGIQILCLGTNAEASQVNLMGGYYRLEAQTQRASGNSSNLGVYQISYQTELFPSLAIGLGYTVLMTETYKGDMSFGPDISLMYFPLSETEASRSETERMVLRSSELIRPFIGGSFHQRQFQSISAAYVGFGVEAGAAFYMTPAYDLRLSLRSLLMNGPNKSEAKQTDVLLGVGFRF